MGDLGVQGDFNVVTGDATVAVGNLDVILGSINTGADIVCGGSISLVTGPLIVYNNEPGVGGQGLVSGGPSDPPYWDEIPRVSVTKYYQSTPVIDMNSAAQVKLFTSASPDMVPGAFPFITYTSGGAGGFEVLSSGAYNVIVKLLASTAQYRSQVSVLLDGSFIESVLTYYDGATTTAQPVLLNVTLNISAGQILTIESEPIVAGTVNVNGDDSNGRSTSTLTIIRLGNGQ